MPADAIVDIATLTGACMVALGDDVGGMWAASEALAAEVSAASKEAGECGVGRQAPNP